MNSQDVQEVMTQAKSVTEKTIHPKPLKSECELTMLQEKYILPKLPSLKWNSSRRYWCNRPQRRPISHLFLRLHLSPGQSVSHQWALSSSRKSATRRKPLAARPHPCFHSCHLQRLASCVITHSRRLLTKTLFTNPPVFTRCRKVDLTWFTAYSFHSGVSVNVLIRVFTTLKKKTTQQNIYFWNDDTPQRLWYIPKLNTN